MTNAIATKDTLKELERSLQQALEIAGFSAERTKKSLARLNFLILSAAFRDLVQQLSHDERANLNSTINSKDMVEQEREIMRAMSQRFSAEELQVAVTKTTQQALTRYFQFIVTRVGQNKGMQIRTILHAIDIDIPSQ